MNQLKSSNQMLKLIEFCEKFDIDFEKIPNIVTMATRNSKLPDVRLNEFQYPENYYPDSQATPWHNPKIYDWVEMLESAYQDIKMEALSIFTKNIMSSHPQNTELANNGAWNTFFFYKNGERLSENLKLCPKTAEVINKIPGTNRAGRVYFSAMTPGTHVRPHCGPHNYKLRCHLGLVTSPLATIRVGKTIKSWEDGRCLVFDDSFEHEVWNNSNITRIVLIVDVWNPVLTNDEITALLHLGIPTA